MWGVRSSLSPATLGPMPEDLHLTHPGLGFWVTVAIHEREGRYMATADLAEDSREVGVGETPPEAVRTALRALGEPYASEMAVLTPMAHQANSDLIVSAAAGTSWPLAASSPSITWQLNGAARYSP